MTREFLHYGIHFVLPLVIGMTVFKEHRWKMILILLSGILIDIDHLLASPIFDPDRCSIDFHPLHSYWAIGIYVILLIPSRTRIWGIALLIHILADTVDCLLI